uniref:Putative secreted protein n=1 Tax=Anopheles marajoara TaxID=58244 RepID=A0A2M4CFP7_9DIPT
MHHLHLLHLQVFHVSVILLLKSVRTQTPMRRRPSSLICLNERLSDALSHCQSVISIVATCWRVIVEAVA